MLSSLLSSGARRLTSRPRILLLRPSGSSAGSLERVGDVYHVPVIRVVVLWNGLRRLVVELEKGCDWLVLTSPRTPAILASAGVVELVSRLGVRVAVVGPKTRVEAERVGLHVDLVPREYRGFALGCELASFKPKRVVLARSAEAIPDLPHVLREAGIEVVEIPIYKVEEDVHRACVAAGFAATVDYVVYTSPSIARTMAKAYDTLDIDPAKLKAKHVAIGPTTASAIRKLLGVEPLQPQEYTLDGVAKLIASLHW